VGQLKDQQMAGLLIGAEKGLEGMELGWASYCERSGRGLEKIHGKRSYVGCHRGKMFAVLRGFHGIDFRVRMISRHDRRQEG
jgi:hypothetical protein